MRLNHLRSVDLNLLVVLQALLEKRSVTSAAGAIGLTQPATSRALGRLRVLFGDELLVRDRGGYRPTPRALEIERELAELLPRVHRLIHQAPFDPAAAQAAVRIAATDYGVHVVLAALLPRLEASAPGLSLDIRPWSDRTFDDLRRGDLDLVLWANQAPAGLRRQRLFREKFVCLVREGHPVAEKTLTLKRYLDFPHVVVSLLDTQQTAVEESLARHDRQRSVRVKVPYFGAALSLIEQSDAILTLGSRMARDHLRRGPFSLLIPPVEIADYDYIQVWHPRTERDPLMIWLRGQILSAVQPD